MPRSYHEFVDFVKKEVKDAGGIVRIVDTDYVKADELRVNGYFEDGTTTENPMEIAVAANKPRHIWLATLCHEFAHFQQHQAQCAAWTNACLPDGTDVGTIMDEWLLGKNFRKDYLHKCVGIYRHLELDCERRSAKNILKFGIPLNYNKYCKRANTYIHFYNYLLQTRKWYIIGKEPWRSKKLVDAMPESLYGRYDKTPQKIFDLYDDFCWS